MFVILALTVPMSLVLRVVTLVFFGGALLVLIATTASRQVALRVDASGVLLGGSPARYRATTRLIPWADISEIVLWRQPLPHGRRMLYVGVSRRPGAPPLAGALWAAGQPGGRPRVHAGQRRHAARQPGGKSLAPGCPRDGCRRRTFRARHPRHRPGHRRGHPIRALIGPQSARTSPAAAVAAGLLSAPGNRRSSPCLADVALIEARLRTAPPLES